MKKQVKSKKLFKRFDVHDGSSTYGEKGDLLPPYAYGCGNSFYNYKGKVPRKGKVEILNLKNAVGFVSEEIIGVLSMCNRGFHAFEAKAFWDYYETNSIWFEVELRNCSAGFDSKWVGRQFKILRRVPVKELMKLCSRAKKEEA